tara:strand:- start:145 stop:330 length:186 start_codon:yes stop_codon:yes gene_type:complete
MITSLKIEWLQRHLSRRKKMESISYLEMGKKWDKSKSRKKKKKKKKNRSRVLWSFKNKKIL